MPEVGVSAGDLISSAAGLSTVDLLVSGVATTAEAEDSGRVGALGTSGVSLPDLLSLLESRLLSFLRGCFSFSFSGVPLIFGVPGAGLVGGGVWVVDLLAKWGGRGFSACGGGAGVGCLVESWLPLTV